MNRAGGGGVVCQLQNMFVACVGFAQLAQSALPHHLTPLAHPPCSAPWKHALWAKGGHVRQQPRASPCCLGLGFPKHTFGVITWCSDALWPSAMQVASEE